LVFDKESSLKKISINESEVSDLSILNNSEVQYLDAKDSSINDIKIDSSKVGIFYINQNNEIQNLVLNNNSFDELYFEQITFRNKISIQNCDKGLITLNLCRLKPIEFTLVQSSIYLELRKTTTNAEQIFNLNESYKSRITLEGCYFSEEVRFIGKIDYLFSKENKSIYINRTVFKELVVFDDNHCRCLVIEESLFQKGLLLPVFNIEDPTEIDSSVWCALKNQALIRNENIRAFDYRKNELISYTHAIRKRRDKKLEWFVLSLNKLSNNHGIDWLKGIVFTLAVWLLFYVLFVLAKDNFYCFSHLDCNFLLTDQQFWSNAINYLWLPQGLNELSSGFKSNQFWINSFLMIFFFLIGKILIAYGIFQTISAFRRHGKA
jgi:hypothetical protein